MKSIIRELQKEAISSNIKVSDLLRKALIVAAKLSLVDFQNWVKKELNGYGDGDEIPKYREIKGTIKARNPYRGWESVKSKDPSYIDKLSHVNAIQTIAELEHLIEEGDKENALQAELPNKIQGNYRWPIAIFFSRSCIVGIVDSVKTIVLNWALKLEQDGILGEGLDFTDEERITAESVPQNIVFFVGPVQSPQIQQGNTQAVQINISNNVDFKAISDFIERLKATLPKISLDENSLLELNAEIRTIETQLESPKPKSTILNECLHSLRKILESGAGAALGHILVEIGKLVY